MEYRGYDIDDKIDVWKSSSLSKYCCDGLNTISLTSEDLKELLEAIENKEKELKSIGFHPDDIYVTIEMTGYDEQYNPNGADWEASFETEISWSEPESDEESKKRIEKIKSRIDQGIEIERKKKENEERKKKEALEQEIQLVKKSGFIVK